MLTLSNSLHCCFAHPVSLSLQPSLPICICILPSYWPCTALRICLSLDLPPTSFLSTYKSVLFTPSKVLFSLPHTFIQPASFLLLFRPPPPFLYLHIPGVLAHLIDVLIFSVTSLNVLFFVCVYPVECLKKTPTLQLTSLPSTPWSFFCNLCLVFALSHILNFQMSVLCMFLLPSPFFLGPPYAAAPKGVHLGALRGCKRWWDATSTSYSQGVENTIPHCWFTLKALTPHPLTSLPFFIAPKLPQNLSELLLPLNTRPTPTCSSCPLSDYICMPLPRKRVCEKGGRLHLLSPVFGCKFRAEERLDGTKNKCTGVEKREKIKGG